jgi:hypothetical protein
MHLMRAQLRLVMLPHDDGCLQRMLRDVEQRVVHAIRELALEVAVVANRLRFCCFLSNLRLGSCEIDFVLVAVHHVVVSVRIPVGSVHDPIQTVTDTSVRLPDRAQYPHHSAFLRR